MDRRFVWVPVVSLVFGCSSADFGVNAGPGGATDTGGTSDTFVPSPDVGPDAAPDDATGGPEAEPPPLDGAVRDGNVPDTNLIDSGGVVVVDAGPATCPAVSDPADVYVDLKGTAAFPTGTSACPFKSVTAALTYLASLPAGKRVIHVKGGTATAPYVYVEPGSIGIRKDWTLLGDGPRLAEIQGGGPCGTATCVAYVESGGTINGVTINAKGNRHAIVTGPTGATTAPVIMNAFATGATGDGNFGVLVTGGAILGPFIEVFGNARAGVTIWGSGLVRVVDAPNRFDANGQAGISVEGGTLQFEGGYASFNEGNGIRFLGTTLTTHTVRKLNAQGNKAAGISANTFASLVLRDSTLLKNPFGLVFTYGASNQLDLGKDGAPGNNVFGTATLTTQNKYAGVCLQMIRPGNVTAEGNRWSTCTATTPPTVPGSSTEQLYAGCESFTLYRDVYYRFATGGGASSPVQTFGCTVAP